MQKAILLLKASKTIRGSAFSLLRKIFLGIASLSLINYLLFQRLFVFNIDKVDINASYLLTFSLLITISYSNLICLYSAFTKIDKEKAKNDFLNFATQLPITQHDYMKAQYLDLLLCNLPGICAISISAGLTAVIHELEHLKLGLGIVIFYLTILFLLQCIDRAFLQLMSNHKMLLFTLLALLPIIVNLPLRKVYHRLYFLHLRGTKTYTLDVQVFKVLTFLGGKFGILLLITTMVLGYYLCCITPFQYSKKKGGQP